MTVSSTRVGTDIWWVIAIGELDLATSNLVFEAIIAVVELPGIRTAVLDLTRATFLDPYGVGVLMKARRILAEAGVRLTVVGATGPVGRMLELSRVDRLLGPAVEPDDGELGRDADRLGRSPWSGRAQRWP